MKALSRSKQMAIKMILSDMNNQDDLFDMPFNLVLQDSQDGEKDLQAREEKDENTERHAKQQIELLNTEN